MSPENSIHPMTTGDKKKRRRRLEKKNNISLSQSGMQSIGTPNTTQFKQENGLFDPTICAFNGNHGIQKRLVSIHTCVHTASTPEEQCE